MTMFDSLAIAYLLVCIGVIGFQFALIAGAPWGHLTQGGQHTGPLALRGRVLAGVSVFLLLAMAFSVLSAAGLWPHWPRWTGWVALGVQALSTLANWVTRSKPERKLWAPITSAMFGLAAIVVLFR